MDKRYSVFTDGYLPQQGTWQGRGSKLMTYKHAAAYAAKIIKNELDNEVTGHELYGGRAHRIW